MNAALVRALLWLAVGLALVVVGTSSGLRLAANGLGCTPWPRCYGAPATAQQVQASALAKAARIAHRIAASSYALVSLLAIVLGWRRWSGAARGVALGVVALTALLAVVGRYTPSPLPAVTLVNVIGGMALLACTGALLARHGRSNGGSLRIGATIALALVALQAAGGTLISVRTAGADCSNGCAGASPAAAAVLWDPLRPGSAAALANDPRAGATMHLAHRLGAIVATLAALLALLGPRGRPVWRPGLAALAFCVSCGLAVYLLEGSLAVTVAHALGAGLLATALSAMPARDHPREEAP
jgi:cytochrome c oxidase assembly protein subunit 15